MDDSTSSTQTGDVPSQKKTLGETASGALSGAKEWFSGMFSKPAQAESTSDMTQVENSDQVVVGGKRKRRLTKSKKSKTIQRRHSKKGHSSKSRKGRRHTRGKTGRRGKSYSRRN